MFFILFTHELLVPILTYAVLVFENKLKHLYSFLKHIRVFYLLWIYSYSINMLLWQRLCLIQTRSVAYLVTRSSNFFN